MNWRSAAFVWFLLAVCAGMSAQSSVTTEPKVSAEDLLAQPVGTNWTSYNGDYTGRRFSSLHEITRCQRRRNFGRRGFSIPATRRGLKRHRWSSAE